MNPLSLPYAPPQPERATQVHLDANLGVMPTPQDVLGLPSGASESDVREAFRRLLQDHPPESDPEGAARLREARDQLMDPSRALHRVLGTLHVPDPEAWDLPDARAADPERDGLTPEARLLGQVALYALVEDALWDEGLQHFVFAELQRLRGGEPR